MASEGRMKGADYMSAPEMVDAALAGLDLGEFATIPSTGEQRSANLCKRASGVAG